MICFVKIDATKVADCIVLSQRLDQSEPSCLDRELSMHCSCCQLSIHVHTTFPVWSNWKLPRVTSRQVIFFPSEKVASMWGKQALLGQGPNSPCVTHKAASFLGFWPIKAKVRSLHPNCNIQTSVVPHGPTWSTPGHRVPHGSVAAQAHALFRWWPPSCPQSPMPFKGEKSIPKLVTQFNRKSNHVNIDMYK